MKNFTLTAALLLLSVIAFAQSNPCPDIQSHAIVPVSSGATCVSKVVVYATGDVSAQKGLNVQVYLGPDATGQKLADNCFAVPPSSPSTAYSTSNFSVACNATITYVITRYTASNGNCQGGTCGSTITRVGTPDGGVLPIVLSSFFAQRNSTGVTLSWRTAMESNAKEFAIERNTGNGFAVVGTVAAADNFGGNSYAFADNANMTKTVSEYRIKMVDKDGAYKYSEIRTVKGTAAASDFTIFPNPSTGTTKVSVTDIQEATTMYIIDNSGRVIKTIPINSSGNIEVSGLQKGMYMVRIANERTGESTTKKLTVIN